MILNDQEMNFIIGVKQDNDKLKAENASLKIKLEKSEEKIKTVLTEVESIKNNWLYKLFFRKG